ncbi:MAG: MYXO-CTERM sorting domain-containing protein, partial [Kofleriaceae bacterium]
VKMPQAAPERDADELEYEPVRRIPHPRMRKTPSPDPVVQRTMGLAPPLATLANFEGQGAGLTGFQPGGVPPDTDGDIGPNHYVQVVNTSVTVFSRTGTILLGPAPTGSVFNGFVGACGQSNDGDATIRYDHIADRWVIAQFSIGNNAQGPYYQCVAVSTSPDPTGTYARYQFNYNALNDYPKIGLWPDGYYFTFNMFNFTAGTFLGGKICAMDRVKMLAGATDATMQCFDAGENYGGLLAADVDGHASPPVGAPNYVIALDQDTAHAFWKLHVDFTTPANSTFTGPTPITVAAFDPLCGGSTCVVQPTGGSQLASLADRAMNRFVYRRFADHESLLLAHSVTAGAGGGIRWYELRNPATTPTVFQSGTYAPDGAYRWIPSIAMDGAGQIAVAYTVSSSTINPSIRFAGRAATDAPGTFGIAESVIVNGTGAQTGINRWGDYAALNIDPVDDCTFWATHEYHGTPNGGGNWRTRIASFQLPNCGSFALPHADDETVSQEGMATYAIPTTTASGAAQMLTMNATGLPAGVTATFTPASVMSGTAASIALAADATAALGTTHYTITATSPSSSFATTDVALTVTAPLPPDAGSGSGSNGEGGESGGCCEASRGSSPLGSILLGGLVLVLVRRRRATISLPSRG